MVGFRKVVAGTVIANWWDNGANAIAFSRGTKGFVAINGESVLVSQTYTTGLAQGTYCDRLTGGVSGTSCAGTSVVVDANGQAQIDLSPISAIAIDISTKL
jgi:alpha-amylase